MFFGFRKQALHDDKARQAVEDTNLAVMAGMARMLEQTPAGKT